VSAVRRVRLRAELGMIVAVAVSMLVACSGAHDRTKPPRTTAPESVPPSAARVAPSVTTPPGTTSVTVLMSNGVERSYRLHAPPPIPPAGPAPLVIVLHGATGNAARVELRYHWDGLADRAGFFVVYPQGLLDQWNATLDPRAADDVRFLSALIDRLAQTLPVDSGRVYVAGMSNGGSMTYRLGCALADRIAAIAAVEAASFGCRPGRAVSLVAVHGLADRQVSFDSAQQSVAAWRDSDRCPRDPIATRAGLVTHSVWAPCTAGTSVELYAVGGGGHEWPGSSPPLSGHDPPSPALDATQAIWEFFRQHHL
jgi:polyhydroxybutyrate depolymerase